MEEKYTILSIPSRRYPTEQAFLVEVISKGLGRRGHRVISIMQSDTPLGRIQQLPWNDSQVYVLPAISAGSVLKRVINLFLKIIFVRRVVKTKFIIEKPDVIQIRNDWAVALVLLPLVKRWGIPLVFQYSFPATESYLERARSQTALLGSLSKFTAKLVQRILVFIMRRSDHILPISEWMQKELADWGIPDEKMTPFPMGFDAGILQKDIDASHIREEYQLQDHPTVLYFGAMDKRRNLELLLNAMRRVIEIMPQARLLMVGGMPEEIEVLKKTARELDLTDQIIFSGHVPYHDIPRYVLAADVGVSPIPPISLYSISSPTKLVETLGIGRPVVGNDIPEQEKIISESGGGFCVPYTEEAFASAILKLLASPDLRERMSIAGQKYIMEERSYSIMTDRMVAVYRKLLSP